MAERSWSFSNVFRSVFGASDTVTDETWDELETALIAADFGPEVADDVIGSLRGEAERHRVTEASELRRMLREALAERLAAFDPTLHLSERPAVILVVGVNGVGKTTTIG
ncbi:MAG: signal recognition particle receptor subunit alpha, partial [Leucobacter sp.]|nr:signal recognition particle receptor subunit alpha [Leucobacter sp.]